MKEILLVDCCIRREQSRTARLAQAFVEGLDPQKFHVSVVRPDEEQLRPFDGPLLQSRDALLAEGALVHPRFRYAHQFAEAEHVVFAAPFWDMSFPAYLKVYVENISAEGITFRSTEAGLEGLCRGKNLILLTTRGGYYGGTDMDQASAYLNALKQFYGFQQFRCVSAEGLDTGIDPTLPVAKAEAEARVLAASL